MENFNSNIQLKSLNAESIQAPQISTKSLPLSAIKTTDLSLPTIKLDALSSFAKSQRYMNQVKSNYSKAKVEEEIEAPKYMVFDSDDPTQVNSVLDVLSIASDKNTNGGKIFSLSTFWNEYKNMAYNRTIAPLKEGDVGTAIRNNLVSLGETNDLLSNYVKAMMPQYWTNARYDKHMKHDTISQRLKNAAGYNGKRFSYNWDVNLPEGNNFGEKLGMGIWNFVITLGLEMISDPLNWFKFGTGAIFKASTAEDFVDEFADAGIKLSDEEASTIIKKYFQASAGESNWDDRIKKLITGESAAWDDFYKFTNGLIAGKFEAAGMDLPSAGYVNKWIDSVMHNVEERITDKVSLNILTGLSGLSDKVNDTLNVIGSPAFFGGAEILRWGGGGALKYIGNRIAEAKKKYIQDPNLGIAFKARKEVQDEIVQLMSNLKPIVNITPAQAKSYLDSDIADAAFNQMSALNKFFSAIPPEEDAFSTYARLTKEIKRISGYDSLEEFCENIIKEVNDGNSFLAKMYDVEGLEMSLKSLLDSEQVLIHKTAFEDATSAMFKFSKDISDLRYRSYVDDYFEPTLDEIIEYFNTGRISNKVIHNDLDIAWALAKTYSKQGYNGLLLNLKKYFKPEVFEDLKDIIESDEYYKDLITNKAPREFVVDLILDNAELVPKYTLGGYIPNESNIVHNFWLNDVAKFKLNKATDKEAVQIVTEYMKRIDKSITENIAQTRLKLDAIEPLITTKALSDATDKIHEVLEQYEELVMITERDDTINRILHLTDKGYRNFLIDSYLRGRNEYLERLNATAKVYQDAFQKQFTFEDTIKALTDTRVASGEKIFKTAREYMEKYKFLEIHHNTDFDQVYTPKMGRAKVKELKEILSENNFYGVAGKRDKEQVSFLDTILDNINLFDENGEVLKVDPRSYTHSKYVKYGDKFTDVASEEGFDEALAEHLAFVKSHPITLEQFMTMIGKQDVASNLDWRDAAKELALVNTFSDAIDDLIVLDELDITEDDLPTTFEDLIDFYFNSKAISSAQTFMARINKFKMEILEPLEEYLDSTVTISRDLKLTIDSDILYKTEEHQKAFNTFDLLNNIYQGIDDLTRGNRVLAADEDAISLYINRSQALAMMTQGVIPETLIDMDKPNGLFDQILAYAEKFPQGFMDGRVDTIVDNIHNLRQKAIEIKTVRAAAYRLNQILPDPAFYTAALETLAGFNNADAHKFATESYFWRFINNMEANLAGKFVSRAISQDAFRAEFSESISGKLVANSEALAAAIDLFGKDNADEYLDRILNHGHDDPGADILATLLFSKLKLGTRFNNYMKNNALSALGIDIETGELGLDGKSWIGTTNHDSGQLLQIGIVDPTTFETTVYRLDSITDPLHSSAKVVYCKTERELLEKLSEAFDPITGKNKFFGYNTERFDMPFLLYRMERYGSYFCEDNNFYKMCSNMQNIDFSKDFYRAISIKEGVPQLSNAQMLKIKEFMQQYSNTRIQQGNVKIQNIKPGQIKHYIKRLTNSIRYDKLENGTDLNNFLKVVSDYTAPLENNIENYVNSIDSIYNFGDIIYKDISKMDNKMEYLYNTWLSLVKP